MSVSEAVEATPIGFPCAVRHARKMAQHEQVRDPLDQLLIGEAALIQPSSLEWHCCFTKPSHERDADQAFKRAGFETLFPRFQLIRRSRHKEIRPLFPRYTFVRFDWKVDPWRRAVQDHIQREVGQMMVSSFMRPLVVPDRVVEELQAQMAADGVIYPPEPRQMRRGDVARPLTGPFVGFTGICSLTSKDRVTLLLSLFGRNTPVEYKREDVELVA